MLFGPAMPILFPICFIKLAMFYVVERFMLAYFYKRPPMLDASINISTIRVLSVAPLIYAFSAAIFYSNQ